MSQARRCGRALILAAALAMAGPAVTEPARAQNAAAAPTTFAAPVVTIYPGDVIGENMVAEREFTQLRPVRGGYVASAESLIGKVARRTLMPGLAIPQNAVENAKLVQKGTPTQLVFEDGALIITTLVSPLQAGELNEAIRARNIDSGLIVYGIVQENGTLRAAGG
ncbi:flagellar basal body P-ring formation chaperone FlgA [Pseudochelatococcus sp. B33]